MLLFACTQEEGIEANSSAVELTGIETVIGNMNATRADAGNIGIKGTNGYIGRQFFHDGDKMTMTKFQRTDNPLVLYSYKNINYSSNSNGAWTRTTTEPDRIYWTDNSNYHTIIGYSCPKTWSEDKWTCESAEDLNYFGYFTHNDGVVDFTDSVKIANEDLLLSYNTEMQSEPGGYVAKLHYNHALASVKVTVNIMDFAADEELQDVKTQVTNLNILNQPWKYKWAQIPVPDVNDIDHPGWGVQKLNPDADEQQSVTLKTWLRDTEGIGTNRNKTFSFRSLIVPGKQDEIAMSFTVKYPDAHNPAVMVTKTYKARLNHSGSHEGGNYREGVFFEPGKTTTINISLNHKNEEITIGAEYIDWENVETPDQTNLSKYSTYLATNNRTDVTVSEDTKATIEDATWLYKNSQDKLVDIYGNDGSAEHPFTIKTALQFLSFAYEVKEVQDFEGKYVKLDASLVLQPETEPDGGSLGSWAKPQWIGIGDDSHAFNGTFIGTTRYVRYLYGEPLFENIGANGKVCGLTLENVISVTSDGMLAGKNAGTICACIANIHNKTNFTSAFNGLCGTNTGSIVACGTIGPDNAREANAGICGTNSGSIIACYSGIKSKAGVAATNSGTITGCYYDSDKASGTSADVSAPLTTEEMQLKSFVTTLNNAIDTWCGTDDAKAHFKNHRFSYRAAFYPNVR